MKRTILGVALLLAACNSNNPAPMPDAGGGGPDAAAMGVCGTDNFALVALTDYQTPGHAAKLRLDTFALTDNVLPLGEDSALKRIGDTLWVINEYGATDADNVQSYALPALTAVVPQTSTGPGTDPQDLVIGDDGRVYVCELEGPGIRILNGPEIYLSSLDPDGKPNCTAIYKRGHLLYAFLALWDDTQQYKPPRGPGKVAVVDISTFPGHLIGTFDLMSLNPSGRVIDEPGTPNVLVAATADYSGTAGGIERVDIDARISRGWVLTAAQIGNRYVSDFVVGGNGEAFVSAVDPASTEGQSNLLPFTMAGQVGAPMAPAQHAAGMAIDACNQLWVVERGYGAGASNGLYVFDAASKQMKGTRPIQTSLPPRFWGGIVFIP